MLLQRWVLEELEQMCVEEVEILKNDQDLSFYTPGIFHLGAQKQIFLALSEKIIFFPGWRKNTT